MLKKAPRGLFKVESRKLKAEKPLNAFLLGRKRAESLQNLKYFFMLNVYIILSKRSVGVSPGKRPLFAIDLSPIIFKSRVISNGGAADI